MGGWVTVNTAAHDPALLGAILISAADMTAMGQNSPRARIVAEMADDMKSLAGVTADSMADDVIDHAKGFDFASSLDGLSKTPMLVLSSNDGLAPATEALVKALRAKGNKNVKAVHADTDHSWSDHRIFLETQVINWLGTLQGAQ